VNSPDPAVHIYPTRNEMGAAAARTVSRAIVEVLALKPQVRMVFAAAPSQLEFLAALIADQGIPWQRVVGFHMDEYFGLAHNAPQSFALFLRTHLFDRVPFGRVECLDPTTQSPEEECRRYTKLLVEAPIDIVCMGIGENGHIAFNDPPIADFADPLVVKIADLDDQCRQQQVNDGCFPSMEAVPRQAITLTIPAMLAAPLIFAVVPGPQKARAVRDALRGPISTACPASALRTHPHVELFLDVHSASLLG
jgi:glucosamine-6-phosphate deaminase